MKRGPKPKPTAIKRRKGNPGKRPLNDDDTRFASGTPKCPAHLSAAAKVEWKRIIPILRAAGVLTHADRALITGYCVAWGQFIEADKRVQKHGAVESGRSGIPFMSPHFNVMTSALKQMHRLALELGLSPSSRSRITVATTGAMDTAEPGLPFRVFSRVETRVGL